MKYILILMLVLISGCVQNVQTEKKETIPVPAEVIVVGAEAAMAENPVKEFSVRKTSSGFSPDTIDVDVGDSVRLFITDVDGENELERIGISGMDIESFYTQGTSVVFEFKASKKGLFEFGDESRAERKGLIIVS